MTPDTLAALQARAYRDMRPWTAGDFAGILGQAGVVLTTAEAAFCLGRVVLDEAEVLTLATDPGAQRKGQGSQALTGFLAQARARGAVRVYLEVASANEKAIAFYEHHGFVHGVRRGYYLRPDGRRDDALLLSRSVTRGHAAPG